MLVLSRKENEKVLFPNLGIAMQILRVGGGSRMVLERDDLGPCPPPVVGPADEQAVVIVVPVE